MAVKTLKVVVISAVAIGGVIASLAIRHHTQAQLRKGQQQLDKEHSELAALNAENHRLSNSVIQARRLAAYASLEQPSAELARLSAEAEALRKRTNELITARLTNSRSSPALPSIPAPTRGSSRDFYGAEHVVSDADSEEYKHELYKIGAASPHFGSFNIDARKDAQNLGEAVRRYAREHQGEVPSSFGVVAPYLFKEYRVPNADEYEIVYQGSLDDLTNIPQQAIALVRERTPWPTPAGKLGRLYVMANGFVRIVESDDNFQTWEAEHIVPPPANR